MSERPARFQGPEPRYLAVYRRLAAQVASGELRPGQRLQSERALGQRLGVSRETLRRALDRLVEDGSVVPSAGRGWFVAEGPLAPAAFVSFTGMGEARGLRASARVLEQTVRAAELDEAELLGMAPGNDLFELRRLRLFDNAVVAIDHSRLPLGRVPGLVDVDWGTASLYGELDRQAGISPVRCAYVVKAIAADRTAAELLEVEQGAPLLVNEQAVFDQHDRSIELGVVTYRSDRFNFRAELTRPRDAGS